MVGKTIAVAILCLGTAKAVGPLELVQQTVKSAGPISGAGAKFRQRPLEVACEEASYLVQPKAQKGAGYEIITKPLGFSCIVANVFQKGEEGIGGYLPQGIDVKLADNLGGFSSANPSESEYNIPAVLEVLRSVQSTDETWSPELVTYTNQLLGSTRQLDQVELARELEQRLTNFQSAGLRRTEYLRPQGVSSPILDMPLKLGAGVNEIASQSLQGFQELNLGAGVNGIASQSLRGFEEAPKADPLPIGLPANFNGLQQSRSGLAYASASAGGRPTAWTYRRNAEFVFPDMV